MSLGEINLKDEEYEFLFRKFRDDRSRSLPRVFVQLKIEDLQIWNPGELARG